MHCVRMKRVRTRTGKTVRRCAQFSGARSRRRGGGYRTRSRMAKRGSHCTRYRRVRSKYGGTVRRCARFSGKARRGGYRRPKRGYKRGHRPFNKGRKCVAYRMTSGGRRCASFGGRPRSMKTPQWVSMRGRGLLPRLLPATAGPTAYGPKRAFPGLFG